MSFLSSIFGGGNTPSAPTAPTFQADPLVNSTNTELNNFGTNVLNGILPSSYQDLIQTNSPQFQTMLNNSNAQIQGSALQTAAMQGNARSGAAQAGTTQAIASNTANLSYSDLLNTQLNQKALLGTGLSSIQAANTGALTNQGQTNSFASSIYGDLTQQYGQQLGYNQAMTGLSANLGSQLIGGAGSAIANSPYLSSIMGGGSSSSGIAGDLGAIGSNAGVAAAPDFTSTIDALISSGAPLALSAA
jgi:hypothetical protein